MFLHYIYIYTSYYISSWINHFPILNLDHDNTFLKTMGLWSFWRLEVGCNPPTLQLPGALPECWHPAFGRLSIRAINLKDAMNGSEWMMGIQLYQMMCWKMLDSHGIPLKNTPWNSTEEFRRTKKGVCVCHLRCSCCVSLKPDTFSEG